MNPVKTIIFLLILALLSASCSNDAPAPTASPIVGHPASAEPAELLPFFVELVRSEEMGGRPELLLVPRQSLTGSLPKTLGPDSIYLGSQPIPPEIISHLNRLVSEVPSSWSLAEVEPLNDKLPITTDWRISVSRPFQIDGDRWYALVHQFREETSDEPLFIKKVLVVDFSFENGEVRDPKYNVILIANQVKFSR